MVATHTQLIDRARNLFALCKSGELQHFDALSFLFSAYLVLLKEIGKAPEELTALTDRANAFKRARAIEGLRTMIENCREGRFSDLSELCQRFSDLRKVAHNADQFDREVSMTDQELAGFYRASDIAEKGLEAYLADTREYFERAYLERFSDCYYSSFEDVVRFFQVLRPEEIDTTFDELRAKWHVGQVELATRAWEWRLDEKKFKHYANVFPEYVEHALRNDVYPSEFGTNQDEVNTWLRRAALIRATELVRQVRDGGHGIEELRRLCVRHTIALEEVGFWGTFSDLETSSHTMLEARREGTERKNLEQVCRERGMLYSKDLTREECTALWRKINVLDSRKRAAGEFVSYFMDIDDDGTDATRLELVAGALYRRGISHEEVGITRHDFVTQLISALVQRARENLREVQNRGPEYMFDEHDIDLPQAVSNIRELISAGVANYEDFGVTSESLAKLG